MDKSLNQYIGAYKDSFSYSFDNHIILNWYARRITVLAKPTDRVLELGIGHGYTTRLFSEHFADHAVIEASSAVIEQFKAQHATAKADIIQGYFEGFETDRRFDVIVMGFVLEHVEDPAGILRQFRKFLAPGARCFLTVPNAESLHRRVAHEAGILPDLSALGAGDRALGHRRLYTVASLTGELEANGYEIARKEGIFLKPFATRQLESLKLDAAIIEGMCQVGIEYPELSAALLFEAVADSRKFS